MALARTRSKGREVVVGDTWGGGKRSPGWGRGSGHCKHNHQERQKVQERVPGSDTGPFLCQGTTQNAFRIDCVFWGIF